MKIGNWFECEDDTIVSCFILVGVLGLFGIMFWSNAYTEVEKARAKGPETVKRIIVEAKND